MPAAGADPEPLHLLVDSTGLKLCGKGEWLLDKHGIATRRSWRALHLGVDAATSRIVAATPTSKDVDDASQADPLLDQVAKPVASFTGDGTYDENRAYASVAERHPEAAVVVPPRVTAVPSGTAESAPTHRDCHLQHIAEHGRIAWQTASGYNRRARVEATMNRWKQVIGDELRAHTDERWATEVAVAAHVILLGSCGHPEAIFELEVFAGAAGEGDGGKAAVRHGGLQAPGRGPGDQHGAYGRVGGGRGRASHPTLVSRWIRRCGQANRAALAAAAPVLKPVPVPTADRPTTPGGRVERLMRRHGVRGLIAQRWRGQATHSRHALPVAPNLLQRKLSETSRPNQVWLPGLADGIQRSARGVQHACSDDQAALTKAGIIASMSRRANPWHNAPMESFCHTLKTELVHHSSYATRNDAKRDLLSYVEGFYNRQRPHSAPPCRTPDQAEQQATNVA